MKSRLADEGGQAVAEFALVLPLFLAIATAVIQLGLTFNSYLNLTDAVRAGARVASVSARSSDPVATSTAAVQSAAGGLDTSKLGVTVTSSWQSGNTVTVSATYPYTFSIFGIAVTSGSLTSSTTERVE